MKTEIHGQRGREPKKKKKTRSVARSDDLIRSQVRSSVKRTFTEATGDSRDFRAPRKILRLARRRPMKRATEKRRNAACLFAMHFRQVPPRP